MALSIFLAKLFGIYLLTFGLLIVLRGQVVFATVEAVLANRELLFFSGIIALVAGIAMIISHSVWELNWRGLITLFGYMLFAKGVARIGFPDAPKKATGFVRDGMGRWIWIGILLIAGVYLTWVGFTANR